jgi:hypothetical protein
MTGSEWLACSDPEPMLEFLKGKASDRKLRLFACACVRRMLPLLEDDQERVKANERSQGAIEWAQREPELARKAVEIAERFADREATEADLKTVFLGADEDDDASCYAAGPDAAWTAKATAYRARWVANYCSPTSYLPGAKFRSPASADHDRQQAAQCHLLRDILGNPFRSVSLNPAWLIPEVLNLAQEIYDHRVFDRLPILAATLEEVGCGRRDLLAHCREPGPHVLGCWVVDLLIGKG